jgi:polyhydroxyalkanoate synthesis regulator phasin
MLQEILKGKRATRWVALLAGASLAGAAWGADAPAPEPAAASSGAASAEELRNTVINILDALVKKGVLTREQAQALVADAQAKAEASARAKAAQEEAEKDAVRVTYVPQIVRDQIVSEVSSQVRKDVAAQVVQKAKSERWGVPGALPEWIKKVRIYGDVRARAEDAIYASDNLPGYYLNWQAVNAAGGIGKAGLNAPLNVSENRPRLVGRLRLGAVIDLGGNLRADLRIASGALNNPISTNQTVGGYGYHWTLGVDKAAIIWNPHARSWRSEFDVRAGRFDNPFATNSELIWDADLMFEGLSATYNWNRVRGWDERTSRWLFVTAGAFPLQDIELSSKDKWLYGAQIGTEIPFSWDSKLRIAGGLYDYRNVVGVRNSLDSNVNDFTAPSYLTKGNTLFDIRNDTDTSTNLFALAGKYRLLTGLVQLDLLTFGDKHVLVNGEYVKNIGWKTSDVYARTGSLVVARTAGYEFGVVVGDPKVSAWGRWRAGVSYRSLQRDAVLDAFTDSDFHLGGTDARGYIVLVDLGLGRSAFARLRYLSANEIDGAPLGIDVVQLDLVGQF